MARDLNTAAPKLDDLIKNLGTVSTAANESFPSLGDALERGRPALIRARPLIQDLRRLGKQASPATKDLDLLTASLQQTKGVERINDFVYYLALSTNGFDALGHYLRAGLVTNSCSTYVMTPASTEACNARFFSAFGSASAEPRNAEFGEQARKSRGSVSPQGTLLQGLLGSAGDGSETRERNQGLKRMRKQAQGGSPALQGKEPMLDYLLGGSG